MLFEKDLSNLCNECSKVDKTEVIRTAASFALLAVMLVVVIVWEPKPATSIHISKEQIKQYTTEQLFRYAYEVNAEMERRTKE